jgi:hypothetical protein
MDEKFSLIEGLLIGVTIIYVVIEVALNLNDERDDTTNIILYHASMKKSFFIPFGLGAIGGHLFLGTTDSLFLIFDQIFNGLLSVLVLLVLCGIMLLIGYKVEFKRPKYFLGTLFFLGLAYGHFFWSMNLNLVN